MLGQMESVLGADSTIQSLCDDIVNHYEKYRANLLTGKAMMPGVFPPNCNEDLSAHSGNSPELERKNRCCYDKRK